MNVVLVNQNREAAPVTEKQAVELMQTELETSQKANRLSFLKNLVKIRSKTTR